jgi:predicted NAD/FAD-dependent oxidoreductase
MRVAVVGAGLAGLAAARELRAGGHEVVVFEKSRGLGGRLAARRAGGAVLDHGSPAIAAPEGTGLRGLADALPADDRVDVEDGIAYRSGATRLPKLMAEGLDVVAGVRLAALRESGAGLELGDEQGNSHGAAGAVVVTAPAPQAADLLERSPEPAERVALLRGLAYEPAVMVLAGVRLDRAPDWTAARPGAGPLAEVRNEASKGREPADGALPFVARLAPAESAALLEASDEAVLDRALPALAGLLGPAGADPAWAHVKRWRLAVPAGRLDPEEVNGPGSRVVVAGDAVTGASFGGADHHAVFASGVWAARRVSATVPPPRA